MIPATPAAEPTVKADAALAAEEEAAAAEPEAEGEPDAEPVADPEAELAPEAEADPDLNCQLEYLMRKEGQDIRSSQTTVGRTSLDSFLVRVIYFSSRIDYSDSTINQSPFVTIVGWTYTEVPDATATV